MASDASRRMRRGLVKESVRADVTLEQQRREWEEYAAALLLAPGTRSEPEVIGGVPCLWVVSENGCDAGAILYAHGGGLVTGSAVTHRELASRLAAASGRRVLLVDYRLMPEHPFPAPLEDFLRVHRTLRDAGRLAPGQVLFGGDSNGAGLALAAMVALREAREHQPAGAFFISGAFDATLSGETMATRAEIDPLLSMAVLQDWQRHLGGVDLRSAVLSPLFADLGGLASVLIEVGEHEMWLSDSVRVAGKIQAAGGEARLHVWQDMWHVWPMWGDLPEAAAVIAEISAFVRARLGAGRAVLRGV
jgi:epsilon-lactone hydrolase